MIGGSTRATWPDCAHRARSPAPTFWQSAGIERSQVLFIGGRSGVGKSTLAWTLHERLIALDVHHAVIEGDALDLAHPAPWEHHLAKRNLAAMWANYRGLGIDG